MPAPSLDGGTAVGSSSGSADGRGTTSRARGTSSVGSPARSAAGTGPAVVAGVGTRKKRSPTSSASAYVKAKKEWFQRGRGGPDEERDFEAAGAGVEGKEKVEVWEPTRGKMTVRFAVEPHPEREVVVQVVFADG